MTADVAFGEHRTDRLVIRRFLAEDATTLATYRSDPAVARYQGWDTPVSYEQARSFIESLQTANPDTPGEWFQFAVIEATSGTHIGDLAARVDADDPRLVTIGVTMATFAQGRGYAAEAGAWLLDYLLLDRNKHRVTADCDARNRDAVALLERLGIRREGHHLQSAWWKDEWVDEYVYAILSKEWLERRSPG
jgi:aminoglycoside 6'-N-acetyltransferase